MGRKAKDDTITVNEGLYLNDKDGVYHCYFRIEGIAFRRSTKTGDLASAKLKALQWHRDVQRKADAGEEIECITFARLKRAYIDHIKGQGKLDYHYRTIEKHILPFFS